MKKISIEDLHNKKQHISILDVLYQYTDGITLQDLTYLLTNKKNLYNLSYLVSRFGNKNRKGLFLTRQRINDCCSDLKYLGLIKKINKKYYLNYPGIMLYTQYLENQQEINKWVKLNEENFKKYYKIIITGEEKISKQELIEIENEILNDIKQGKPAPWHKCYNESDFDEDEL